MTGAPIFGPRPTPAVAGPLERALARRLGALLGVDDEAQLAAVALAAAAPRAGHVCVELDRVVPVTEQQRDQLPVGQEPLLTAVPDPGAWTASLLAGPLARRADETADDSADGDGDVVGRSATPLVVDGTRCYLDRYWGHEEALRAAVVERTADPAPDVAIDVVRDVLDRVVPRRAAAPEDEVDRQRLAVANALLRRFSVLSGGPGTGKTHTVVSLLVARLLLAEATGMRPPRIALAAPTGKAAARMEEAVREAVASRDLPPGVVSQLGQVRGTTLHRLLGYRVGTPTRFRHDDRNPLPHDLVVVDEASMVALAMTRRLVEAVAPTATLVLVGDRDQLTSVEAGAVLGDLCGPVPAPGASTLRLSTGWMATLAAATGEPLAAAVDVQVAPGVWDAIVQLDRFHRFGGDSGIGATARAIQAGDPTRVVDLLGGGAAGQTSLTLFHDDVTLLRPTDGRLPDRVREIVVPAARAVLDAARAGDAGAALAALEAVGVLCATRVGPLGVDEIRARVERWLAADRPQHDVVVGGSYVGRPVLVTRNDPDLGLLNGDVGVTLERDGVTVVAFPDGDGVREVAAVRLPSHETVWAMTIHKAQGSQYAHAVVVLPSSDTRVLSRELLYTGVTRAKERLTVVAEESILRAAVQRPVRRATGLADRLWPQA